jgi:hypothetical protein
MSEPIPPKKPESTQNLTSGSSARPALSAKEARLKAALRDNLRRRKVASHEDATSQHRNPDQD